MLTIAPENRHPDLRDTREAASQRLARVNDAMPAPGPTAPVVFSDPERRALNLIDDDPQLIIATAIDTATALVGDERDQEGLALVAKLIAAEHVRQLDLARRVDELAMCRDLEALKIFERRLTASTKRLCMLLAEHRARCSVGQRTAVVVGSAQNVTVKAGR